MNACVQMSKIDSQFKVRLYHIHECVFVYVSTVTVLVRYYDNKQYLFI